MTPSFCTLLMSVTVLCSSRLVADESSVHIEGLRENVPNIWALQHARVFVRAGRMINDATIVVRGGKILSVTARGPLPDDARAVDMTGKTIYPGFIDAYSETKLDSDHLRNSAAYWNHSVVPQLSVATQLKENEDLKKLRKQGIVAQLRAPAEKVIRGQSAIVSTGTEVPSTALLAANVAQHLQLTVNNKSRDVFPGSPMGAVALARQAMYDAMWYASAWNAANADPSLPRPERNNALAALAPVLSGDQPIIVETTNELFFLRAERFAAEFGLNLIVRGSGHEYRRLKEIAATDRFVILPLNFPQPPNVSTVETAANVTLESMMHWDIAPENPARVHKAGIPFAFTTDRLDSIDEFLEQIRKAVERGLSADAALNALTEAPARRFGVSDQLGAIERGKLASFVVTNGNLFESDTKIEETWVDGLRFRHSPKPNRSLEGRYEIELIERGELPNRLFVEFTTEDDKAKGRISRKPMPVKQDDDESKDNERKKSPAKKSAAKKSPAKKKDSGEIRTLKTVRLRDFAATGYFKSDDWGDDGMARVSLIFSEDPEDNESRLVAFGQIMWPNGVRTRANVYRVKPADGEDSDEQNSSDPDETDSESGEIVQASFDVNYPLGAFGMDGPPKAARSVALVNATIWTCGPKGIIENGMMLIENGRIVGVGGKLLLPAGVQKIDVRGMHITPGIIDCHSHMATDGGVNESTQAVTCEVRIGDFIDCDDITIYRQLAGGVTTSNILHGSANPIGGQNQVIKLRWGMTGEEMKFTEAPQGVKFALGENVKQSNWGDEYTTRYPQTRMGVEQIFRDSLVAAQEYAARMDAWKQNRRGLPPRRDLELDALREIVEGSRWIHCHSYRQDEILALIRLLDEYDITIGTFQHILEGYKVADAMAEHGAMGSAFSDWWAYKFEVYDGIPYAGAIMHEAGVVVSFNSDDAELGTRLNQEAAKAVKYGGVSEEEALKFVTLNPAKQLRIEQHVGSLEKGKHADIAIWNGPPLSNFSRCEQTWVDGRVYFDRKRDAASRKQIQNMRNTLTQKILASGEKMRGVGDDDDDPSAMWPRHDEFCHHGHDDHDHGHGGAHNHEEHQHLN